MTCLLKEKHLTPSESGGEGVGSGVGEILVKTSRGRIVGEGRIDAAGWFHTGDLGRWVPCAAGSASGARQLLEVVDRMGIVVKLANGKFLSPSHAEAVFEVSLHSKNHSDTSSLIFK